MFTGKEHVAEMQKLLEPHEVRVASFDAVRYLKVTEQFTKFRQQRMQAKAEPAGLELI